MNFHKQSVIYPNLFICGITANNSSRFQAPCVSVYKNRVDISRANGASIIFYDIEHVDVLKGSLASLFFREVVVDVELIALLFIEVLFGITLWYAGFNKEFE